MKYKNRTPNPLTRCCDHGYLCSIVTERVGRFLEEPGPLIQLGITVIGPVDSPLRLTPFYSVKTLNITFYSFVVLGIKPRTSLILGKCSSTGYIPSLRVVFTLELAKK